METVEQKLRNIHQPIEHIYGKIACKEDGQRYPCTTIRILDGTPDERDQP